MSMRLVSQISWLMVDKLYHRSNTLEVLMIEKERQSWALATTIKMVDMSLNYLMVIVKSITMPKLLAAPSSKVKARKVITTHLDLVKIMVNLIPTLDLFSNTHHQLSKNTQTPSQPLMCQTDNLTQEILDKTCNLISCWWWSLVNFPPTKNHKNTIRRMKCLIIILLLTYPCMSNKEVLLPTISTHLNSLMKMSQNHLIGDMNKGHRLATLLSTLILLLSSNNINSSSKSRIIISLYKDLLVSHSNNIMFRSKITMLIRKNQRNHQWDVRCCKIHLVT